MDYLIVLFNGLAIIFLVALNGFFVASEFSIVKIRTSRLDTLVKEGISGAEEAKEVTDHLDAYLSVTQLGITIASLGLGWIGEPTVARLMEPVFRFFNVPHQLVHTVAFVFGFSFITALHIILGELVPKSLSIQKTEQIVLWVSGPLRLFNKLMYPVVWFMNNIAAAILRCMGVEAVTEAEEAHNEEEIRLLMEESHKHGYIDKNELLYLDNVFDFGDRVAGEIMVPRTDMLCLFTDDSFDVNVKAALNGNKTRYPICDEDKDNIVGFLHVSDLLRAQSSGTKPNVRTLAREVLVVPEALPISKLLRMLQKKRCQLAIIVDEYDGTAGMITVEDILEEIVGDIQDEFDQERPEIEDLGNKTFSLDGRMLIEDFNDLFELELDTEYCDTIGGWVFSKIDYPPRIGQVVEADGVVFTVKETDKMRIVRVDAKLLREPENIHEDLQEDNIDTI